MSSNSSNRWVLTYHAGMEALSVIERQGRFRTRYEAASQKALDAYFGDHAERLRQDFRSRFSEGLVPSREVWTEVERWGADPEDVR